jgi:hypothetical protein
MATGLDASGVYTISQDDYQMVRDNWAATGDPGSMADFLFQMLTQGGRAIAGGSGGYSSYPQIVSDLAAHGINVNEWGLPTLQQVNANPSAYVGINQIGMPVATPGAAPPAPAGGPAPAPLTGQPAQPEAPVPVNPDQLTAFRAVKTFLEEVGLGDLATLTEGGNGVEAGPGGWLWDEVVKKGYTTAEEVQSALDSNDQWRERFQVHYDQLKQVGTGQPVQVLSAAQIRQYEIDAAGMMRAFNMPTNLYDNYKDFQSLMLQGVSMESLNKAITVSWNRVANAGDQIRQAFTDLYGPAGDQLMASYFLDNAQFESKLDVMSRAASLKGTAKGIGFDIGLSISEQLAQAGYEGDTARSGLADVATQSQLFDENISEQQDLTAETGVAARFGLSGQAAADVKNRQQKRAAALGGGGTGSVTQQGLLSDRTVT